MNAKKAKDLITAILFLVLGLATIYLLIPTGVVVPGSVDISALSPDFWPIMIAWGVVVSSAFLLVEAITLKAPESEDDSEEDARYKLETLPATLRIVILIFALFLFYFEITRVGIVAGSIVLMPAMMLYFGERNWKYVIPLSILIPIGLYLFFLHVAGIPMPLGIFEALL